MAVLLTGATRTTISANGNRMTNLVDPVDSQDAVTVAYLEANSGNAGILILEEGDANIEVVTGTLVRIGGRYLIYTGSDATTVSWPTGDDEDDVRAALPATFQIFVPEALYNFITGPVSAELTMEGADFSTDAMTFEVISEDAYNALQTGGTLVPNRLYYVVDDNTPGGVVQAANGGTGLNPASGNPGDILVINGDGDGYNFIARSPLISLGTENELTTLSFNSATGRIDGFNEFRGIWPTAFADGFFPGNIIREGNLVSFDGQIYRWEGAPSVDLGTANHAAHVPGTNAQWVTQTDSGVEFEDSAGATTELTSITFNDEGDEMTLTGGGRTRVFSGGGGGADLQVVTTSTPEVGDVVYIPSNPGGLPSNYTLPATVEDGDCIYFVNESEITTNTITPQSTQRIHGQSIGENLVLDNPEASFKMIYYADRTEWLIITSV